MNILITGASGFLGYHTVQALIQRGYTVYCLGRTAPNFSSPPSNVHFIKHDLLCSQLTPRLFEENSIDVLLHLAWDVTPGKYWTAMENLAWVRASLELFQAAITARVKKIIGAGSSAEYDWSSKVLQEEVMLYADQGPLQPRTLYGEAKYSLFRLMMQACEVAQIPCAWGRVFFPYGPREAHARLVPSVITSLLAGVTAPCSHGLQERDFIYIKDVASAFACLVESEITGAVNVASGQTVSIRAIVNELIAILGGAANFGAIPSRAEEPKRLSACIKELSSVGWSASTSLRQGLEESVQYWINEQSETRPQAAQQARCG